MHWIGRLLYFLSGLTILIGVLMAVTGAFRFTWFLMLAAVIALSIGIMLSLAARLFLRGAGTKGALLIAVALIAAATAYVAVYPGGTAFLALLPVIIVSVVLPFVRTTTLMWIFAASWIAGAGLVALNIFLIPPARLPPWLDLPFRATGYASLLALTLGMLFHHHRRLTSNLETAKADAEALRKAHQRQKEADETKARFLNSAAHELRTPLTPIMIQMTLLRRHPAVRDDPRLLSSTSLIDRNLHRLKSHVDDLLDLAHLQSGRFSLKHRKFDLHDLTREAVGSYREFAAERRVRLVSSIPPGTWIQGDPDRLLQVIFDLLSNALKATPPKGRITISSHLDDQFCQIHVTDTGRGIDPKDQKRLFEPFEPAGATDGGAGLGLFICRTIVESHGGRIECESEGPGKGSTFTVTLPRIPPSRGENATRPHGAPRHDPLPTPSAPRKIARVHRQPPTQTP